MVWAGTFSSVDWPIGVQLVILFYMYFKFFICSPKPQAHHVSFYYTLGPASVGVRPSTILKSFFKTAWPINLCGASLERGNKRLIPASGSHNQNGRNAPLRKHAHMFYTPSFTLLYSRKGEMRGTQNESLFSGLD